VKEGGGGVLGHGREGAAGEKGCRAVVRPFYRRGGCAVTGKGNGGWRGVPRGGVRWGRRGLVPTSGRRPDRQRPGRDAQVARRLPEQRSVRGP
jgi:hypothetical protein